MTRKQLSSASAAEIRQIHASRQAWFNAISLFALLLSLGCSVYLHITVKNCKLEETHQQHQHTEVQAQIIKKRGESGTGGRGGWPGPDGLSGRYGNHGAPGEDGNEGAPGRAGNNGEPGRDGNDGAPGEKGRPGGESGRQALNEVLLTRWGVHTCLGDSTSEVYIGFAAAVEVSSGTISGSPALQCIRTIVTHADAARNLTEGPVLSSIKIKLLGGVTPTASSYEWRQLDGNRLPCVVCKVAEATTKVLMFGSINCDNGYIPAYRGYAMAPWKRGTTAVSSEPICVSETPKPLSRTAFYSTDNTNSLAVEYSFLRAGSDAAGWGGANKIVPCVVCTRQPPSST